MSDVIKHKGKTISTRWSDWTRSSPLDKILARITLGLLAMSLNGLWLHLFVLQGVWRTVGLIAMIAFVAIAEGIMIWRATKHPTVWWWVWFWGAWICGGVAGFEIVSYIVSSIYGV